MRQNRQERERLPKIAAERLNDEWQSKIMKLELNIRAPLPIFNLRRQLKDELTK